MEFHIVFKEFSYVLCPREMTVEKFSMEIPWNLFRGNSRVWSKPTGISEMQDRQISRKGQRSDYCVSF